LLFETNNEKFSLRRVKSNIPIISYYIAGALVDINVKLHYFCKSFSLPITLQVKVLHWHVVKHSLLKYTPNLVKKSL